MGVNISQLPTLELAQLLQTELQLFSLVNTELKDLCFCELQ